MPLSRSIARRGLLLLAGIVAVRGAVLAAGPDVPAEGKSWLRTDTPHFTLFGNVGERALIESARKLELFREALKKATAGLSKDSPVPTHVFVFDKSEAFAPFALGEDGKPRTIDGYFLPAADRNFIVMDASGRETPFRVVFHEYVHYVIANNLPGAPLWLNEGFAEFYSTLTAIPGKPAARMGEAIPEHVAILRRNGIMPVERLFAIDHDSPEYNESTRQGVFYAESWYLVHWLIADDEARRTRFNEFVNRLRRGEAPAAAFRDALQTTPAAVELALTAYSRRDYVNFFTFQFDEEFTNRTYRAAPVPPAEALARLADLMVRLGPPSHTGAKARIDAALALDPTQPIAQLAAANLERARGKWDEAAAAFERALSRGGPAAKTNYGWMLLDRYVSEHPTFNLEPGLPPAPIQKARALFQESLAAAPDDPLALSGLARSYLFADEDVSGGIAAGARAHEILPGRPDVTGDLIGLLAAAGRTTEARAVFERDLSRETDRMDLIEIAERDIARGEWKRAAAAAEAGRPDEARGILEAAAAKTNDPEVRARLLADLERLQRVSHENQDIAKYNDAARAAKAGDLELAQSLYREVAESATNPELKKSAEEMAHRTASAAAERRAIARAQKAFEKANRGDLAGAVKDLDAILKSEPDLPETTRASLTKALGTMKESLGKR